MSTIQELRSYKIFGLAIFDLSLGMIGLVIAFLIAHGYYFQNLDRKNFILAGVLLTVPVGIAAHILTGTNTKLNYELGLSYKP